MWENILWLDQSNRLTTVDTKTGTDFIHVICKQMNVYNKNKGGYGQNANGYKENLWSYSLRKEPFSFKMNV